MSVKFSAVDERKTAREQRMERQTLKCFKQPKFQNINVSRGHTSCTLSTTFQHFWVVSPSVTCYNWGGFPERGSGVIRRGVISWVCGSVNGEHVCQITERFPSFYCLSATILKKEQCTPIVAYWYHYQQHWHCFYYRNLVYYQAVWPSRYLKWFNIFRLDRKGRTGGGVCIYVRSNTDLPRSRNENARDRPPFRGRGSFFRGGGALPVMRPLSTFSDSC